MSTPTRHALADLTLVLAVIWLLLSVALIAQTDDADVDGVSIALDTVRADPNWFVDARVSLSAIVHRVVGPRLFAVGDVENARDAGAVLVLVSPPAIAVVHQQAIVTITGTVRPFAAADLTHYWGWSGEISAGERDLNTRIVIVADQVTGDGAALVVSPVLAWRRASRLPAGSGSPLRDVGPLAWSTDATLVGRAVDLRDARISAITSTGGFWVASGGEQVFVLTADEIHLQRGRRVNILGVVLQLPDAMRNRLGDYDAARNESIYVYAPQVRAR